jgi:ubiquinone/menaquinone biosynthesis C-methylase UbiE
MAEFDEYTKTYEQEINSVLSIFGKELYFFSSVKAQHISQILSKTFSHKENIDVLDIGCGNGIIHPHLLSLCPKINLLGVDVAHEFLLEGKKKNTQIKHIVYDGDNLPFKNNSFDFAYTISVMHHVVPIKWDSFMKEMKRVVRPNGQLLVFEMNPYNPGAQYVAKTCSFDKDAILLRPGKLKSIILNAGLIDIQTCFILFTPFKSKFFKWVEKTFSSVPLGAHFYVLGLVPDE